MRINPHTLEIQSLFFHNSKHNMASSLKRDLDKYSNQFKLIAPYSEAKQLVIFPHSGYKFFLNILVSKLVVEILVARDE